MHVYNFLFLVLLTPALSYAVFTPPRSSSAGVVEREIEREYEGEEIPAEKEFPLIELDIPEEELEGEDGEKILIDAVQFKGNTIFSTEELQGFLSTYLHRELSLGEIRSLCLLIRREYARRGYFLVRIYPPAQKIENGVLHLHVVEGRLGKVTVIGNKYYKTRFIEKYFSPLRGEPINYDHFIKTVMLLNENEGLTTGVVFKKGEMVGQADIIVQVVDQRPIHLYFDHNNYGSPLNTVQRTGGRFDVGNLATDGDYLRLTGVGGNPFKNLRFIDVDYRVPVNAYGTSVNGSYLYSDFDINRLRSFHLKGRSEIASLGVKQAHLRTKKMNLDYSCGFDFKQIKNLAGSQTVSYDKLRVIKFGAYVDYIDSVKGRTISEITLHVGLPNFLGGSKAVDRQCSRQGAGGRFEYLYATFKRLQQLPYDTFLYLNLEGQLSANKLPLPEQFYIGSVDTVRGFQVASGLGDQGYFTNVEFRFPLPFLAEDKILSTRKKWKDVLQFVAFFDHGQTFLMSRVSGETRRLLMTSWGLGGRLKLPYHFEFSVDAGFPLTSQKKTSSSIVYYRISWQPF